MSLDLHDLGKLGVDDLTDAWLNGRAQATGRSKQSIAREALRQVALKEIHEATVLTRIAGIYESEGEA